jgi:VCBS repeat-containing protein
MAYASAEGGGYGADASIIHFDPAHADHIQVPDAELLFRGEYQRLGPDLVLTGPDGRHHIIPGYFSSEQHPALVAPNGASLAPDLVDLLAGSPTPGQYAQAQPTTPPDAIGKCEKVVGSVTVVRNGVAVALHVGDAVFKSDVVQTGANSSVGIGFPDGTALNLVANTRMALNDYSFDASSTSNSANGLSFNVGGTSGAYDLSITATTCAGETQTQNYVLTVTDNGGDPMVVPGTSNVIGNINFAAPNPADSLTASVTPQGSDYVGTFTLDPLTKSNGTASLGFHFDLGNDQINLAPGQTLTQSYGVTVADAQNPAMNVNQTVSVTVGGPDGDNFVFKPGIGLDTIVNFDPTHDTIELDHFANAQTVQQLESLITSDAHGDAVIALGHHDSITVANVTAAQVQQLAQSGHVLMH